MVVYGTDEQGEPQGGGDADPMGSEPTKGSSKEKLERVPKSERGIQESVEGSVSPGTGLFTPTGSTSVSRIQQIEQLKKENEDLRDENADLKRRACELWRQVMEAESKCK